MDFKELQSWMDSQTVLWQQLLSKEVEIDADSIDWQPLFAACKQLAEQQGIGLQSELADAMAHQTKGFCRYGLRLLKHLKEPHAADSLETAVMDFSQHLQAQALQVLLRQWQVPEALVRIASANAPQTDAANPLSVIDQLLQQFALETKQGRLINLTNALQQFNASLLRYRDRLQELNYQTARELLARLQNQQQPDSLSALHAAWVDCYEQSYQQMLLGDDYQALYGELTNSTLRLQKLGREFWQQEYRQAGLVPQQDYDELLQRHHALRKQLRCSERTARESNTQITARFNAMEQTIEQMRSATEQRPREIEGTQLSPLRKRTR